MADKVTELWADLELASGPSNAVTIADERTASVVVVDEDLYDGDKLVETKIVEITIELDSCDARVTLPLDLLLEHISAAVDRQ